MSAIERTTGTERETLECGDRPLDRSWICQFRALAAGWEAGSWEASRVLRGLRGRHGGPHGGTRALALVLVLLLAAPLTVLVWRVLTAVLRPVF